MARDGNPAEEVVERVLDKLKEERLISGFLRNRPSDRLDSEGIDFLIFLNNELALALQVKTDGGRWEFSEKLKEHRRKHPLIKNLICVPIHRLSNDPERVYKEVEKELRGMLKI